MADKRYVGSWDEVTDDEIEAFYDSAHALLDKMLPVDGDGDPPVNIILIDRRKYWPLQYYPVIYNHNRNENGKEEEALLDNLDLAIESLRKFRWRHRERPDPVSEVTP